MMAEPILLKKGDMTAAVGRRRLVVEICLLIRERSMLVEEMPLLAIQPTSSLLLAEISLLPWETLSRLLVIEISFLIIGMYLLLEETRTR